MIDLVDEKAPETIRLLQTVRTPTILLQPSLEAPVGNFWCGGRADAIRLNRDRQGRLEVLIADIKASRQEKVEHRVQVAVYARMIEAIARANQNSTGFPERHDPDHARQWDNSCIITRHAYI